MESAEPAVRRSGDMELSAFDLVILQYLVQKIRENPIPTVVKEKLVGWGRRAHDNVASLFGLGLPRSLEQVGDAVKVLAPTRKCQYCGVRPGRIVTLGKDDFVSHRRACKPPSLP